MPHNRLIIWGWMSICFVATAFNMPINAAPLLLQDWSVNPHPVIGPGTNSPAAGVTVLKTGGLFQAWHDNAGAGMNKVMRTTSTDGVTWSESQVVYTPMNPEDSNPEVVLKNGTYHLWVGARGGTTSLATEYATSSDGITWTKQGQITTDNFFQFRSVLATSTGFEAWYRPRDSVDGYHYATSTDGLNWLDEGVVLPVGVGGEFDENIAGLDVLKIGGSYHMWYSAGVGGTNKPAYATSSDGVNWTKHGILDGFGAVSGNISSISVLHENNELQMWFHEDNTASVFHATSPVVPSPAAAGLGLPLLGLLGLTRPRRLR